MQRTTLDGLALWRRRRSSGRDGPWGALEAADGVNRVTGRNHCHHRRVLGDDFHEKYGTRDCRCIAARRTSAAFACMSRFGRFRVRHQRCIRRAHGIAVWRNIFGQIRRADDAIVGDVIMYARALMMSRHANQHRRRCVPLNGQRNGQQPCQHDLQKLAHCQSVRQAAVSRCERCCRPSISGCHRLAPAAVR